MLAVGDRYSVTMLLGTLMSAFALWAVKRTNKLYYRRAVNVVTFQ